MIIKAQNVQKCTKDWHLPAHDLTFPPILPRNQRCYGLIGQHLAPAHFGNLDAFKAGIHLTKAVHLEPEAHEAPRVATKEVVWGTFSRPRLPALQGGENHSFALRQLHGSKASKTAASASRAPLRGAIILGAIVASERHDVQKNEPQRCAVCSCIASTLQHEGCKSERISCRILSSHCCQSSWNSLKYLSFFYLCVQSPDLGKLAKGNAEMHGHPSWVHPFWVTSKKKN